MFGNGTELTSLRVVSDSMMTEFNPNYEFGGNLYSFKDLSQIPRENIALVKLVTLWFSQPEHDEMLSHLICLFVDFIILFWQYLP